MGCIQQKINPSPNLIFTVEKKKVNEKKNYFKKSSQVLRSRKIRKLNLSPIIEMPSENEVSVIE